MKRALLLCIVGLLCIGTYSYATDFDEVGVGAVSSPLNAMLNIVHYDESTYVFQPVTGSVTAHNGTNYVQSNGDTLFTKEVLVGDSIVFTSEPSARYTVTLITNDTGIIVFTPDYQGQTTSFANIIVSRPALLIENNEVGKLLTVSRGGRVGIGKFPSSLALLSVKGTIQIGSDNPGTLATSVLCWTNAGLIGRCTNAPSSSGKCNCNPIN